MFYGVGQYLILVAAVALVLRGLRRRYLAVSLGGAVLCSALNLAHETWQANFQVNLGWTPFLLAAGVAFALPITFLVGVPFLMVRRSRLAARPAAVHHEPE